VTWLERIALSAPTRIAAVWIHPRPFSRETAVSIHEVLIRRNPQNTSLEVLYCGTPVGETGEARGARGTRYGGDRDPLPARGRGNNMAVREGWRGRFFEDFEVGNVYEHPLGRTVTTTDNAWFTLLTQNTAPKLFLFHKY
jgi:hypothetical protein